MATTINASNGSTSGLISTGDASGVLQLQVNNGTPALTLNTTQALGVGTSPSYGTSGQFLTSAGSGAAPTWTSAPASAMTLISTQTANNTSGYLTWTGLSGYNKYILIFENINATSTATTLNLQVGYGSTPTYITSNYNYYYSSGAAAVATYSSVASTSQIVIARALPSAITGPWGGACTLTGFTTLANAGVTSNFYTGSSANGGVAGGYVGTSSNPITAIQIFFNGGINTLVSGTASLYGISS